MAARLELLFFSVLAFGFHAVDAVPKKEYVGVVGGEPARIQDFPYQVSIRVMDEHICGGTVIHEQFVLTAAHCTTRHPFLYSLFSVRAGTANAEEGGRIYEIEKIIDHHLNEYFGDFDLSIIKLKDSLELSDKVAIAKLSKLENGFDEGTVFNITGWGTTESGSISKILLRSEVPLVNQQTCKNDYESLTEVNNHMFCAGADGHDACQGDSGGPLSLNGEVVGVVSRGLYCGMKEFPTIYMKISEFQQWIKNTVNGHL